MELKSSVDYSGSGQIEADVDKNLSLDQLNDSSSVTTMSNRKLL